jgi:hypothetical protein
VVVSPSFEGGATDTVVRVNRQGDLVGNEAVHPGAMEMRDNIRAVENALNWEKFIADWTITMPKRADELYDIRPAEKRKGLERRDHTTESQRQNQHCRDRLLRCCALRAKPQLTQQF